MKTAKYEMLWPVAILVITILIFSGLTGDQYHWINRVLHGPSRVFLIPFTFLWLTLILLGIREWQNKFQRKNSILILIVVNTLVLFATGFFIYGVFVSSTIDALFEGFFSGITGKDVGSSEMYASDRILLIFTGTLPLLLIAEVFLVRRWRKIYKLS